MSVARRPIGAVVGEWLSINLVGFGSFVFTRLLNSCTIHHHEKLLKYLDDHYENDRPIITISNHSCNIDDPLIWGALLKPR